MGWVLDTTSSKNVSNQEPIKFDGLLFKLISFFVPKAVKTLSDKAYSLLSVSVKTASFLLFFFSKCTPPVPSTRA